MLSVLMQHLEVHHLEMQQLEVQDLEVLQEQEVRQVRPYEGLLRRISYLHLCDVAAAACQHARCDQE